MTDRPNDDEQRKADLAAGTKPSAGDPQRTGPADAPEAMASGANTAPDPMDEIDEAIYESFPASDPPSYTGSSCSPSDPNQKKSASNQKK